MKQVRKTLALMTGFAVMIMSGCSLHISPKVSDIAESIRQRFTQCAEVTTTAEITADYGNTVYLFELRYTGNPEAGTVTVISPECISGLSASYGDGQMSLEYDGASFDTGRLCKSIPSPVGIFPLLLSQWRDGFTAETGRDSFNGTDSVSIKTEIDEKTSQSTWFDSETCLPIYSEVYYEGQTVLSCTFRDMIIT